MSDHQDRRRLPQPAVIRFPFKFPRHPAGEPLPDASEVFGFQARACIDVPDVDDGLVICLPDGVGGWVWHLLPITPSLVSTFSLDTIILPELQSVTFTNAPAGATQWLTARAVDLSGATQIRFRAAQTAAASTGTLLYVNGNNLPLGESSAQLDVTMSNVGFVSLDSGWLDLDVATFGADDAVVLRVYTSGGNGVADPAISTLTILVRRPVAREA